MKKLILAAALLFGASFYSFAQNPETESPETQTEETQVEETVEEAE